MNLGPPAHVSVSMDTEHLSDTTASAGGSDEEVTSQHNQENTPPVSMDEMSGGFDSQDTNTYIVEDVGTSSRGNDGETTIEAAGTLAMTRELHELRLTLLQHFTHYIQHLSSVGGLRAIPFMQVTMGGRI